MTATEAFGELAELAKLNNSARECLEAYLDGNPVIAVLEIDKAASTPGRIIYYDVPAPALLDCLTECREFLSSRA